MDFLLTVVTAFGALGLFWYGFARSTVTKKEWVNGERDKARQFVITGIGFLILGIIILSILEM
jgi:succinate-acetate transporter protein